MSLLSKFQNQRGLFGRMARGGAWLGVASASEQGFRFVRNMLLARLLAPQAFGLMAIVLSVCSLLQVLTGLGIKEAIVQNPRGAEPSFLNGAWWIALARGLFLYLAALLAAPWVAGFYDAPELAGLLRIAFIGVLAQGAMSAGAYVAVKQMRYSRWVLVQQGGSIIGIATTLTLAFVLKGVLALVIGYATEGIARCLLSYIFCPFKPHWKFCRDDMHSLLHFAGGMFGLPVLMMIYNEGAVFVAGKICTKQDLGIFAMALTVARIPSMFSNQVSELLMPVFSEIQRDPRRVNQGVLKFTTLAVIVGLPATVFISVFGREILSVAYGSRYAAGWLPLCFLFLNELILFCNVPLVTVYMALGKPWLLRRFSLIRASLIVLLSWPLIHRWNIVGAAAVPLISMVAAFGFQLYRLRILTNLELNLYTDLWRRALLISLPCGLGAICLRQFLGGFEAVGRLLSAVTIVAVIVGVVGAVALRERSIRNYFWPFARKT
jgi:lipopolysaccharide exporter